MESSTKNKKSRPQIAAMVAKAFDGASLADGDEAIEELKDGWFNASYAIGLADGRQVVLKIAPPKDADVMLYEKNIMATEVATMRLVQQNPAIPVPEIYFYDDSHSLCAVDYFFMEMIRGDNLEHVKKSLPPETQTAVSQHIGQIIKEINHFPGTFFGYDGNPHLRAGTWKEAFIKIVESVLADAARKDVQFDCSVDEIRAAIHKHAPALEEIQTPCLVHWDAWDLNIFVKNGRVSGIIDFERALWAEPLMEAQFRHFNGTPSDTLRGYGKTTFSFAEEQRMQLYSLHLALIMFVECFFRNYDTDAVFNYSRDAIAKTMAWLTTNPATP